VSSLQTAPDGKPMLSVSDAADLEQWLATEHSRTSGVWLVRARPGSDHPSVDYEHMIAVLLRYGWIDASVKVLDERRSLLWVSPRRPGSVWSRPNKQRVARLTELGLLEPPGQAAVERAIADGSWTVLDGPENLDIPHDLAAAFADDPQASANFDAFPASVRKAYLSHIALAKTDATRAKRVAFVVERSAANLRPGA
jgi:uncharacterized protein YdeI (YjbR/CyaY-like superfamily)